MLKTRTRTRTRTKQTLPKKHQIIPAPKSNKKMQDKLKQYKKKKFKHYESMNRQATWTLALTFLHGYTFFKLAFYRLLFSFSFLSFFPFRHLFLPKLVRLLNLYTRIFSQCVSPCFSSLSLSFIF